MNSAEPGDGGVNLRDASALRLQNGVVRQRGWTIRVVMIAAIALIVVAAASATPWTVNLSGLEGPRVTATASPLPQPTATPTPLTDEQREVARQLGAWVVIPLAVLAATLAAYLLYRFVRRLRRA